MSCRSDDDVMGWFEAASEEAGATQTETLRRILERNCGAAYLKKWLGDVSVRDLEPAALESLFTRSVPLVSHADLEPYIQRIADGDASPLLTQEPITTLSLRFAFLSFFFSVFFGYILSRGGVDMIELNIDYSLGNREKGLFRFS